MIPQDFLWNNAHLSTIYEIDFTEHGFDSQNELHERINDAPEAVIEIVSQKSCKLCHTTRCPCRQTDPP